MKSPVLSKGIKASVAFFIANVVTSGISYITTPLYTRLLSSEEYGQTSVFLTWMQVFGIIAMFCLSYGVFNNGMVEYPEARDEYSFSMLILSNIITLCFSIVLLGVYPYVKNWINMDFSFCVLLCVIFLVKPAYLFWSAKQRYELKYKFVVFYTILSSILSPLTAIICILLFPQSKLLSRIFGAEIILIVLYVCFYIHLAVKAKFKANTKFWKTALLFNLPLIPHYLSSYLLGSSDKLMISHIINDSATAYYSVAYSVASVVTIIWTAANSSLVPYTYEKCKVKDYKSISDVTISIILLFSLGCILIILLAPEVVAIMATKEYKEAIYVIPPVVGGVFFQVHYYIYANILYYYKKPQYVMLGSIIATILNLILNYIFLNLFGYIAAGYTTFFCYFVQACIDYFAMRHAIGEKVYNMKMIGLLSMGLVIVSIFSNILYNYYIIRYIILLVIILFCFVLRKRIIEVIFKVRKKQQ